MYRFLATLLLAALVNGDPCMKPSGKKVPGINPFTPQGRIVGGLPGVITDAPWQVSMQNCNGFHFCGGSIISPTIILTAAHCTFSYPAAMTQVRVGSTTNNIGGTVHKVKEIIRHENYSTNMYGVPVNDIAVLRLGSPITLSPQSLPVVLFNQGETASEGVTAVVTGWGATYEGGSGTVVLRTVQVPIVSKTLCNSDYSAWGGIPEGQICAGFTRGGRDACQGDSGGPMVIGNRLAGVVSWGNGCAEANYPGVYTEVGAFRDWIKANAGV